MPVTFVRLKLIYMRFNWVLYFPVIICTSSALAQKIKKSERQIVENLQKHIRLLSGDEMEGRSTGTKGERLAAAYVAEAFTQIGLEPKGNNNTFYQAFNIYEGKEYNTSSLSFDGENIADTDYFPFPGSPQKKVNEIPSIALREKGVPWFLDLDDILTAHYNDPAFNLQAYIEKTVKEFAKKGATALIVYNTSQYNDSLSFDPHSKATAIPVPVVYINKKTAKRFLSDESAAVSVDMNIVFSDKKRTANNLVGYIDNGAAQTIIIGAHIDHLGKEENEVYNGADDNASGVSAIIELAKMLKTSKLKNNNYLFIAFSGKEIGLLGSQHFAENALVDLTSVNYMINLDMVGRLNENKTLIVDGSATSPAWTKYLTTVSDSKFFNLKYDSNDSYSGDHSSFYKKNIPVLSFFTGEHDDYHKTTDDIEKINYDGEFFIIKYIYSIISATDKEPRLTFTKTVGSQNPANVKVNN